MMRIPPRVEHQHCDLCYSTLIGNTCEYPNQYPDRFNLQCMTNLANTILKAINGISFKSKE